MYAPGGERHGDPHEGAHEDPQHLRGRHGQGLVFILGHALLRAHEGHAEPKGLPQRPEVASGGGQVP